MATAQVELSKELHSTYTDLHANAPADLTSIIRDGTTSIKSTFDPSTAVQPGQKLPSFSLSDAYGKTVTSEEILARGPVILLYYRGAWCPFCNLTLRAYQQHLGEFQKRGVQFVAITGEVPDTSVTSVEKNDLKFPVLSDVGLRLASQLGIVWRQPADMDNVFEFLKIDWKKDYGVTDKELPVPATIFVGGDGIVKEVFVEPNFHERLEPEAAVAWIDKHKL